MPLSYLRPVVSDRLGFRFTIILLTGRQRGQDRLCKAEVGCEKALMKIAYLQVVLIDVMVGSESGGMIFFSFTHGSDTSK